jgi:putative hydrolase of HD superfamily
MNHKLLESFFQKVLELKNVPRKGWKNKLEIKDVESVSDHSYSVAMMSMILSEIQGLNTEKIIKMALLHDLAESVVGDLTPDEIKNVEKINRENQAMKQILKNLPRDISQQYNTLWDDFQNNSSIEANFLHEIDKLEMAFQAKFYLDKGVSKDKLRSFFKTANNEIKNKQLRDILSSILE